jgi:hypothetical protein
MVDVKENKFATAPASPAALDTASVSKEPEKKSPKKLGWSDKTTGEKAYEVTQFLFGKVFIIAITAVLAFMADPRHEGPNKIMGIPLGSLPKWMKGFQKWAHGKMLDNKILPMRGNPTTERIALISSFVLLTSHGGNLFTPFIHWLENSKESISQFFNRAIGKPGEVEKAHEKLKDEPKQSWWDTIKGRAITFPLNFAAIIALDATINKVFGKHKSGHYYFDAYEEKFSRMFAGFSKTGKDIAAVPIKESLTKAQAAHKGYRFGKVIALDIYFTSIALAMWTAISRLSARKRHEKNKAQESPETLPKNEPAAQDTAGIQHENAAAPRPLSHAAGVQKTEKILPLANFTELATQEPANYAMAP